MIKCLVVDDEPLALQVIETYVKRLDYLKLAGTARSAEKAIGILNQEQVDILFLDIRMPKLDGINFLKSLVNPPAVIFVSAYKEHALDGFDLDVVDYLLKPVSFERFLKAINKYMARQSTPARNRTTGDSHSADQYLYLRVDKKRIQKILLADILFVESMKNYVKIKTASQEIISYQNITSLSELLPGNDFVRVHRSFIVAISKIQSLSASDVEINGMSIPVGRMFKNELAKALNYRGIDGT